MEVPVSHRFDTLQTIGPAARGLDAGMAPQENMHMHMDVLAMVGHELRNPISVIATALFLMDRRGHPDDAPQRRVIADQLKALRSLSRQLTDASRVARATLVLHSGPVALDDVMRAALVSTADLFEERGHQLHTLFAPGVRCLADPTRLAQCFANLLANAARYTPPGGDVQFRAAACDDGLRCEVAVCDNGRGIAPEALPHLFDLYYRADPADGDGLGIGLALVKQIAELHGGEVWATSAGEQRGAAFHVRLPMLPSAAPEH
jgi:signal transduction histidine kinase